MRGAASADAAFLLSGRSEQAADPPALHGAAALKLVYKIFINILIV